MKVLEWIVHALREPGDLIAWGGYPAMALIIFLETGALVFFLPGDSLLVVAGVYAARGDLDLLTLNALLIPCAVAGDALSYAIGRKAGPLLFRRERSRFFRPEHLRAAHDFYERHGGKTIVIARFMPIFRTFVPVAAGIADMGYARFAAYNVVGGALWILSMTLVGYTLGQAYPEFTRKYMEWVIVGIVFLSVLPGVVAFLRSRSRADRTPAAPPAPGPETVRP